MRRLLGLPSGGELHIRQAALLDCTNAQILQNWSASLQFASTEAGILSDILFQEPPGLHANLSLIPRPWLLAMMGSLRFTLAKARIFLRLLSDIFSCSRL